ncbi:MAG: hypothetical protein M1812_003429 [Candelaria pacifica]|nr:MAG: hypothetical protein M1812_003429 [Candelaria pacifica]
MATSIKRSDGAGHTSFNGSGGGDKKTTLNRSGAAKTYVGPRREDGTVQSHQLPTATNAHANVPSSSASSASKHHSVSGNQASSRPTTSGSHAGHTVTRATERPDRSTVRAPPTAMTNSRWGQAEVSGGHTSSRHPSSGSTNRPSTSGDTRAPTSSSRHPSSSGDTKAPTSSSRHPSSSGQTTKPSPSRHQSSADLTLKPQTSSRTVTVRPPITSHKDTTQEIPRSNTFYERHGQGQEIALARAGSTSYPSRPIEPRGKEMVVHQPTQGTAAPSRAQTVQVRPTIAEQGRTVRDDRTVRQPAPPTSAPSRAQTVQVRPTVAEQGRTVRDDRNVRFDTHQSKTIGGPSRSQSQSQAQGGAMVPYQSQAPGGEMVPYQAQGTKASSGTTTQLVQQGNVHNQDIINLAQRVEELEAEKDALKKETKQKEVDSEVERLQKQIDRMKVKDERNNEKYHDLQDSLERNRDRNHDLERSLERNRDRNSDLRDSLNHELRRRDRHRCDYWRCYYY